ncbi:MAG: hypothetical protein IPJ59_29210 [Nannocystis sp.]|nr:hypothetical protein [Nannocystis sp.]
MFATPRPGSPINVAGAPSRVSSAVGNARVPSLSFNRLTVIPCQPRPASRVTSTQNSDSPREPATGACAPSSMRASVSAISEVVADVNHLTPCSV